MTTTLKTIVRFPFVDRRTRTTTYGWVKSVSWADGPGMKTKSVQFTFKREEAAGFSTATAMGIAEQYYKGPVFLDLADGTPLDTATRTVNETNRKRATERASAIRTANQEFNQLLSDACAASGIDLRTLAGVR